MNAFRARQQARGRIDVLPPEPKAPARRQARPFPARLETVDADFVVIRGGASRSTNDNHRPAKPRNPSPSPSPSPSLPLRLLAASARLLEAGLQRLPRRAFAGLVAMAFLLVFAQAGGLSALKAALPAAGPVAPLQVADISTSLDDRNGMKVLSVYGRIDNVSGGRQALPPLEIRVEGADRMHQRLLALDAASIAPGGSEHFSLRIPHGGGKVPKVSVSFASARAPAG